MISQLSGMYAAAMPFPILHMTGEEWILFFIAYVVALIGFNAVLWVVRRFPAAENYISIMAFLVVSSAWIVSGRHVPIAGLDFPAFYIAAHLPFKDLYSPAAFTAFGIDRLTQAGVTYFPPYVRPAIFVLLLKPLAYFSFWHAFYLWAAIGFCAYAAALYLLLRWLELPKALPVAFAAFFPAQFGIVTGQDTTVYLLVLLASLLLLLRGKEVAAGCLLAVCTYKFNLLLLIPVVLVCKARWRTMLSFILGAFSIALASAALTPLSQYVSMLRLIPAQVKGLMLGSIRGVTAAIGHHDWYYPIAFLGLMGCIYLIWKLPMKEGFCVAIVGALLFGYHVAWYDCTLLVIPIALAWRHCGVVFRTVLLALFAFPPAWVRGTQLFEVLAESVLLLWFALSAWRSVPDRIPADATTAAAS